MDQNSIQRTLLIRQNAEGFYSKSAGLAFIVAGILVIILGVFTKRYLQVLAYAGYVVGGSMIGHGLQRILRSRGRHASNAESPKESSVKLRQDL